MDQVEELRAALLRITKRINDARKGRDRQEDIEQEKEQGRTEARQKLAETLRAAEKARDAGDDEKLQKLLDLAEDFHDRAQHRADQADSAQKRAVILQREIDHELKRQRKLRQKLERALNAPTFSVSGSICLGGGEPCWGGADSLMDDVESFMLRLGLPLGSGKRTPAVNLAVGGSPTSDHLTTKTTTDARDFPTFSGEDEARKLAQAIARVERGNSGIANWQPNSYTSYNVNIDGYLFRVQILWGAAIGHDDHVHVGIQYLGRS